MTDPTANAPFTRYFDNDANDDGTAGDPILTVAADTTSASVTAADEDIEISVTLQHRVLDTTANSETFGQLVWRTVNTALSIDVTSSDDLVLAVPTTISTEVATGAATLTIAADNAANVATQGNALKDGMVFVTFNETYSAPKRVKVEFKRKGGSGG